MTRTVSIFSKRISIDCVDTTPYLAIKRLSVITSSVERRATKGHPRSTRAISTRIASMDAAAPWPLPNKLPTRPASEPSMSTPPLRKLNQYFHSEIRAAYLTVSPLTRLFST